MNPKLTKGAAHILHLLPLAHGLTRTTGPASLMTAAAVVRHPLVRRFAPRLSSVVSVGLAVFGVIALVKGARTSGFGAAAKPNQRVGRP